jgi:hypothetical protein
VSDEYWNLDIPGLTEAQAGDLERRLKPEFDFGVIVTDPADFMVRGYERSTVELLLECLRIGRTASTEDQREVIGNLIEDFESWLKQANDVGPEA